MRKRMNTTGGEEKWFLAPGTHMNAFQVGHSPCSAPVLGLKSARPGASSKLHCAW